MDKQNKHFLIEMTKENNYHIQNLEKINNERILMNLNHEVEIKKIKAENQEKIIIMKQI